MGHIALFLINELIPLLEKELVGKAPEIEELVMKQYQVLADDLNKWLASRKSA